MTIPRREQVTRPAARPVRAPAVTAGALITALVIGLLGPGSAGAAAVAGTVLVAKGAATAQGADQVPRFLAKGSEVFAGDTIATAKKSFAVVKFTDGAKVTVRPGTELVIDKYSHGEGSDEASLNLVKGGIRALSGLIGQQNPDNFELKTPVAALGIRGTQFDARVCDAQCAAEEEALSKKQNEDSKDEENDDSENGSGSGNEGSDKLELDGLPEGVYFAVYQGKVVLVKDGQIIELSTGQAGYAGAAGFGSLGEVPLFLLFDSIPAPDELGSGAGLFNLACPA